MSHAQRPLRVVGLLIIGLISFSISPILIKLASDAPALSIASWRSIFSVLFLAPFAARSAVPELFRMDRSGLALIALAGIFLAVHFLLWIESLYFTGVASAATLVSASPIFLAVLGYILLGEKLGLKAVLAIIIAVAGSVIVGVGDAGGSTTFSNPLLGNAMALTAALFVSLYLIIGRALRVRLAWLPYVFGMYSMVMIVIVAIALLGGVPLLGLEPEIYLLCACMAIFPQIIGHGSFNYAVKYFDAAFLGLLSLTEPVGGSVIAFFLFGEVPDPVTAVGLVIVLTGLAVGVRAQQQK